MLRARIGDMFATAGELGRNNGYAHWLHSAPGQRPGPMGQVHIVSADRRIHHDSMQNHFLTDIEADANLGRRKLFSNRSGPFKHNKGESRVASRTKHVLFRERGGSTEITIHRNASSREIQMMMNKLRAYNSFSRVIVFLILGNKSHKLGYLNQIDMEKLHQRIISESNRRSIGIRMRHERGATAGGRHVHLNTTPPPRRENF